MRRLFQALWPLALVGFSWAQLGTERRSFQAYDCSVPLGVERVRVARRERDCDSDDLLADVTNRKAASYLLMQKAVYQRFDVLSCSIERSAIYFYCGATDHETHMGDLDTRGMYIAPTTEECRYMHRNKVWLPPAMRPGLLPPTPLNPPQRVTRQYTYPGRSWQDGADGQCHGEDYYTPDGTVRPGIVGSVHETLVLLKEEATRDRFGNITLTRRQLGLECQANELGCQTRAGTTYIWDMPATECWYKRSRTKEIVGEEVSTKDGSITFVSLGESMIRVHKKERVDACEGVLFRTNYKKLFLSADIHHIPFLETIHVRELSATTYTNQQDDFLYNALSVHFQRELTALARKDCEKDEERRSLAYAQMAAEHRAVMDGETVALGEGLFASAAGEVWYRYQCREITVLAVKADRCYNALPVLLAPPDERIYLQEHGLQPQPVNHSDKTPEVFKAPSDEEQKQRFFIEPNSHRLTTVGVSRDCVETLASAYENDLGEWLTAAPHLQLVPSPEQLKYTAVHEVKDAPQFDFEGGGIYDAELVFKQEALLMAPRMAQDISHRLSKNAAQRGFDFNSRIMPASMVLPGLPEIGLGWFTTAWKWLDRWSKFTSMLFGIGILVMIIKWVFRTCLRCQAVYALYGIGSQLLTAICPSCFAITATRQKVERWVQEHHRPTPSGESVEYGFTEDQTSDRNERPAGAATPPGKSERPLVVFKKGKTGRLAAEAALSKEHQQLRDSYYHAEQERTTHGLGGGPAGVPGTDRSPPSAPWMGRPPTTLPDLPPSPPRRGEARPTYPTIPEEDEPISVTETAFTGGAATLAREWRRNWGRVGETTAAVTGGTTSQ
jgi:hypothetical protein